MRPQGQESVTMPQAYCKILRMLEREKYDPLLRGVLIRLDPLYFL